MTQRIRTLYAAVLLCFIPFLLTAETEPDRNSGLKRPVPDETVSIYDDFDDGSFGRSEYRSVYRTVKISAFSRTKTFPAESPSLDKPSHLTALVLSAEREKEIREGYYSQYISLKGGIYHYSREGLEFSFTLEKAGDEIRAVLEEYYQGKNAHWMKPVWDHYQENFIIRIHSAENIFEPWREFIQYSESILMATLLGDREQWLWGIHDGIDILKQP